MSEQNRPDKKRFRSLGIIVTVVFIAAMASLALLNLPKGIDMDLDKIGTGKPAVVFVYDSNLSVSGMQTEAMNKLRDDYDEKLNFLVADVGRPQARDWLQRNQARAAELFFFDAQGSIQQRQSAPLSAEELAAIIHSKLNIHQ